MRLVSLWRARLMHRKDPRGSGCVSGLDGAERARRVAAKHGAVAVQSGGEETWRYCRRRRRLSKPT